MQESEGVQLSTFCRQLKFQAKDGKTYKYESADNEALFRIIQSIPSPKAEPFKRWLAKLGKDRIEEIENPQKAIERGKIYYEQKGYTKEWIETRTQGIQSRKELTKQWKDAGVKDKEYGILTNQIYTSTFGLTAVKYKQVKGLKKTDILRNNMNSLELIVTAFAEQASKEIATSTNAQGLKANQEAIKTAGEIVNNAIRDIEERTKKPIVSTENFKHLNSPEKTKEIIQGENNKSITGPVNFGAAIKKISKAGKPKKQGE